MGAVAAFEKVLTDITSAAVVLGINVVSALGTFGIDVVRGLIPGGA